MGIFQVGIFPGGIFLEPKFLYHILDGYAFRDEQLPYIYISISKLNNLALSDEN